MAPWGIAISPVWRAQSGTPLERLATFTGLNIGSITIPVDPVGTYRSDNVFVTDVRVTKTFTIKERFHVSGLFDAFNIFNSNADNTQDTNTGVRTVTLNGVTTSYQRFLSPTSILPPRIFRIGVRVTF